MDWSGRVPKWPRAVSASNLKSEAGKKIGKKLQTTNNTSKQAEARSRIQWQQKKKSRPFPKLTFFSSPLCISFVILRFPFRTVGFFLWLVSALSFDHIFCPSPPNPKGFCSKRPILPFLASARMGVFKGWTQMNWWCSCIVRKSVLPSQTLKNAIYMLIWQLFDEVLY